MPIPLWPWETTRNTPGDCRTWVRTFNSRLLVNIDFDEHGFPKHPWPNGLAVRIGNERDFNGKEFITDPALKRLILHAVIVDVRYEIVPTKVFYQLPGQLSGYHVMENPLVPIYTVSVYRPDETVLRPFGEPRKHELVYVGQFEVHGRENLFLVNEEGYLDDLKKSGLPITYDYECADRPQR